MLVGIGTIGMITGSIATYFLGHHRREPSNAQVEWLREQLARWDDLPAVARRRLAAMLSGLAHEEDGNGLVLPKDQEVGTAASDSQ